MIIHCTGAFCVIRGGNMHFNIYYQLLVAVLFCALAPPCLSFIHKRSILHLLAIICITGILFITIGVRIFRLGTITQTQNTHQIILSPFWSYREFARADIRWQVYLNILQFVPFGFIIPQSFLQCRRLWYVVIISTGLSILIESVQYLLCIGLCETDDVIHNTVGSILGYSYWHLLSSLQARFRGKKK